MSLDTTVLILSNVQSVARDEIRQSVAALVLGQPLAERETRAFADRPSDVAMAEAVGVYSFGPGFEASIRESNGRPLARAMEKGIPLRTDPSQRHPARPK